MVFILSFGQIDFLRNFVPNFVKTTRPIANLLCENLVFKWSEEVMKAFKEVKISIAKALVLAHPNCKKDFFFHCYVREHTMSIVLL